MISLLRGKVHSIADNRICILCSSGVGYNVYCNNKTLSAIKKEEELDILIHTHVTQEDIQLYGFLDESELNFFKMLIKVNGVGCKMAQSILDLNVESLVEVILNGDIKCLTKIKGVGTKTAQRIILELKNVVDSVYKESVDLLNENMNDAKYALIALGYDVQIIDKTLKGIDGSLSSSDIIKLFMKKIKM